MKSNSTHNVWEMADREDETAKRRSDDGRLPFRRVKTIGDGPEPLTYVPKERKSVTSSSSPGGKSPPFRRVSTTGGADHPPKRSSGRSMSPLRRGRRGGHAQGAAAASPNNSFSSINMTSKSPTTLKVAKEVFLAPVTIATWTGKTAMQATNAVVNTGTAAVVQAGAMTGQAATMTGQAVGTLVGNTTTAVVNTGSLATHAVVDATNAVVDAGTNVGNTVVQSTRAVGTTLGAVVTGRASFGVMKSISMRYNSLKTFKPKKSKWEEGIEAIEELLNPRCPAFQHMTPTQRNKLEGVKKLLIKGPTTSTHNTNTRLAHVPAELVLLQSQHGNNFDPSLQPMDDSSFAFSDTRSFAGSTSVDSTVRARRNSLQASNHFILEQYAGVTNNNNSQRALLNCNLVDEPSEESELLPPVPETAQVKTPRPNQMDSPTASLTDDISDPFTDESEGNEDTTGNETKPTGSPILPDLSKVVSTKRIKPDQLFVPPEFNCLDMDVQLKLFELLQWESINKWDFNMFDLDKLTGGHSMLFVGWAILGAPYSQQAMAKELGTSQEPDPAKGYWFLDELDIPTEKLYNFIKVIEQDYNSSNPYHNSIHGADVLQSLHTLIQMSTQQEFMKSCPKLHIFSILLAALVHDVAHFGTTNVFHNKLQTELAVIYNDKSVLENWHIAHAFARMLDLDLSSPYKRSPEDVAFSKFPQQSKSSSCNLLCNATPEQFQTIRRLMVDAILHTDMTNHFEMVNATRGLLLDQADVDMDDSIGRMSEAENTWSILVYMLHLADISGQAKADPLCNLWTERCFDEFFAQGDQELALGLPISPNCDRDTVMIPESQIGFIKFVVEPAFEVLGQYIPFVQVSVLPIIHDNMMYYLEKQQESDRAMGKELCMKEECRRLHTLEESMREDVSRRSRGTQAEF